MAHILDELTTDFENLGGSIAIPKLKLPKLKEKHTKFFSLAMPFTSQLPKRSRGGMSLAMNLADSAMRGIHNGQLRKSAQDFREFQIKSDQALQEYDAELKGLQLILQQNSGNRDLLRIKLNAHAQQTGDKRLSEDLRQRGEQAAYDRISEMKKFDVGVRERRDEFRRQYMMDIFNQKTRLQQLKPQDIVILDKINQERRMQGKPEMDVEEYMSLRGAFKEQGGFGDLPAIIQTALFKQEFPDLIPEEITTLEKQFNFLQKKFPDDSDEQILEKIKGKEKGSMFESLFEKLNPEEIAELLGGKTLEEIYADRGKDKGGKAGSRVLESMGFERKAEGQPQTEEEVRTMITSALTPVPGKRLITVEQMRQDMQDEYEERKANNDPLAELYNPANYIDLLGEAPRDEEEETGIAPIRQRGERTFTNIP